MEKELMTVREFAQSKGWSTAYVYALIKSGKIDSERKYGKVLVDAQSLRK